MTPASYHEILRALFSTLSGNLDTVWSKEPVPMLGMGRDSLEAYIELAYVSSREMNIDETRLKYDPVNDVNQVVIVGQRQFTITVTARSYEVDLAGHQLLGRIRFRLRTNTARNIFVPQGLALVTMGQIIALNEDADNRMVSKAAMDVVFASSVRQDPGDDDGQYIATVDGGGVIPMTYTQ